MCLWYYYWASHIPFRLCVLRSSAPSYRILMACVGRHFCRSFIAVMIFYVVVCFFLFFAILVCVCVCVCSHLFIFAHFRWHFFVRNFFGWWLRVAPEILLLHLDLSDKFCMFIVTYRRLEAHIYIFLYIQYFTINLVVAFKRTAIPFIKVLRLVMVCRQLSHIAQIWRNEFG